MKASRGAGFVTLLIATALSAACFQSARAEGEDARTFANDAQERIDKGDLHGAEIQLRNAARANPNDPTLHVQLANIYLKLGNLPAAEAEAREAQRTHGSPDAVDPVLSEVLLREDKFISLFQLVQPGKRSTKQEASVRLNLGLAHLELQESQQAEPLLRDAERLDDTALAPKIALTRWYLQVHNVDGAEKELARARAISPDDPEVIEVSADLLATKGEVDEALAQFNTLLRKYPDNVGAAIITADLQIRKGDLKSAQDNIDHALKLVPTNPPAIFLDALLAARAGNLQKADERLSEISDVLSYLPDGYYLLGQVKYALGQIEVAKDSLTKYINRHPDEPTSRRLMAKIDLQQHDAAAAISVLKPVVDANPTDAASVTVLGDAYMAIGERGKALDIYQRAAEAQPSDALVQTRAAVMRLELGQTSEGLTQLEQIANTKDGYAIAKPLIILTDLDNGRILAAENEANAMLKLDPKNIVAWNLLGQIRMAQQRYDDAVKIYSDIVQQDSSLLQVRQSLARAYLANHQPEKAKEIWMALLQDKPDDPVAMMAIAGIDAYTKKFSDAADLLTKARQASPKDPMPGIALLRLYAVQKDMIKVKSLARDLEGQFPANPAVIDAYATVLDEADDPADAVIEYGRLAEASPQSAKIFQRLATFQIRAKQYNSAQESLQKAIELTPEDPKTYGLLVDLKLITGGLDKALETARSFSAKQPVISDIITANLLAKSDRLSEAIKLLKIGQEKHPDTRIVTLLGGLTFQSGDAAGGEAILEAWLNTHEDATPTRVTLGHMYLSQGDLDKAQMMFERVREQFPNDIDSLSGLAWIYAKKGDPRAADTAEQAYRISPTPDVADTLGWVMMENGDSKRALEFLENAAAALPRDLTVQYHLAAAMKATGDNADARTLLERILKSDAKFDGEDDARKLLNELQRG